MEGEPPEILSGTKRETLASLYTAGANPDFVSYGKPRRTRRVPLPGYPFQRKYYWLPES
jgi:acyl transferase domain-containing protein